MKTTTAVLQTEFPTLPAPKRGKVRDMYDLGDDTILAVATDRLSAFDVVMPDPVPDKGKVLTQLSLFWSGLTNRFVKNDVITADPNEYPAICTPYADVLRGRSILVKKVKPLPIECVVRGYITGSGWSSYKKDGTICGITLPGWLRESERLMQTLFTPTTKAPSGEHDENITFNQACEILGRNKAMLVRELSIAIYERGAKFALNKGIIIADTKFEFGETDAGEIILIDEVLTPDSSRFWPLESYEPGRAQDSFDKQYARDYLTGIGWDKKPPAPKLPQEVLERTREKYIQALTLLTGHGPAE